MSMSRAEMIRKFLKGDKEAHKRLGELFKGNVHEYLSNGLGMAENRAREITDAVFAHARRKHAHSVIDLEDSDDELEEKLRNWLFTIARAEIIRRFIEGDEQAYKEVEKRYGGNIQKYLSNRWRIAEDRAWDVTHEVFKSAWKKRHVFQVTPGQADDEVEEGFLKWLYKIARWKALDDYKSGMRSRFSESLEEDSEHSQVSGRRWDVLGDIIKKEEYELLINYIKCYPTDHRLSLYLRLVENLTYEEIAELLKPDWNELPEEERDKITANFRHQVMRDKDFIIKMIITEAVDDYQLLQRMGENISPEDFVALHPFADQFVKKFSDTLRNVIRKELQWEQQWHEWFAKQEPKALKVLFDRLTKKTPNKKKLYERIQQHFVQGRTYQEIAGSLFRAAKLREEVKTEIEKIKDEIKGELEKIKQKLEELKKTHLKGGPHGQEK